MKIKSKNSTKAFSIAMILLLLLSGLPPAQVSAANAFTEASSVKQLVDHLISPNSNISVVSGTEHSMGVLKAASTFTELNLGSKNEKLFSMPDGILVTSGDGTPPLTNTKANYTVQNNSDGDVDLETDIKVANTQDAFSISFQFTVPEGYTAVQFEYMFGSDEYPEYLNTVVDGAAVFVDGVNYAKFSNGTPLKVVTEAEMVSSNGLNIEYDGISAPQKIVALLNKELSVHTVKIVIADTSDKDYDSGLFLSAMKESKATIGGIVDIFPEVIRVEVNPGTVTMKQGQTTQLSAEVEVSGGAAETVTWSSNDETGKVSVNGSGLVSVAADAAPGSYTITATSVFDDTKSDTAVITVTESDGVTSVTVNPETAQVVQGTTRQLQATVVVTGEVDNSVNWSSNDETEKVSVDASGLVSVAADAVPGSYTITATSVFDDTKSDTAVITVVEPDGITSVSVIPKTAKVVQGTTRQLQATVTVSGEADNSVIWSSNDETEKVSVDANGLVSVAEDATPGSYTITATSVFDDTKSDTAVITVVEPDGITSITMSPKTAKVAQGTTKQLQATVEVTGEADNSVTWNSNDETGKVSVDASGLVNVAEDAVPGSYTITATSVFDDTKSDTAVITVVEPDGITSVSVSPKTAKVVQGTTRQLQATVTVTGEADNSVIWSSNDKTEKVSVDASGLVSVAEDATPGSYTITATSVIDSMMSDTAVITVVEPDGVTSVVVSPNAAKVVQGSSRQLQATVVVTGEASDSVIWSSSDETGKVSVDDSGMISVATGANTGSYTILATSVFDPTKSDRAVITVVEPDGVLSVALSPKTAKVVQGMTQQLQATVGITGEASRDVTWNSSDESDGVSVDSNGLVSVASGAALGAYTITATSTFDLTKSDSATISVVEAAGVSSVIVVPHAVSIVRGTTSQLQAVVAVSGGAINTVTWSSDDTTGKVGVDSNGLVSVADDAVPGVYFVKATSDFDPSLYDIVTVTVVDPAMAINITVSPKTTRIIRGGSSQLQAIVSVLGGANNSVIWTSEDPSGKVTIDNNGLVSVSEDAAPGEYVIKASSVFNPSLNDTVTITVIDPDAVNSVVIKPVPTTVLRGRSVQLEATVQITGDANTSILWSSNDSNGKVSVDSNGLVNIAADAPIGQYTIKAVSVFDPSKFDTITFTVNKVEENTNQPDAGVTPDDSEEEKTITVVEVPEGINNPEKIRVVSEDDVFDTSVEVRLKEDSVVREIIMEKLDELEFKDDAGVIVYPLDISIFEKGTDNKVQPKEGTTVDIICPIPDSLLDYKDKLLVICVIDGKLYALPTSVVDEEGVECVKFTAKHFSPYAFIVDTYGQYADYITDMNNGSSENDTDASENDNSTDTDTETSEDLSNNDDGQEDDTNNNNQSDPDNDSNEDGNDQDSTAIDGDSDLNDVPVPADNIGNEDLPKTGEQVYPMGMLLLAFASIGSMLVVYIKMNRKAHE